MGYKAVFAAFSVMVITAFAAHAEPLRAHICTDDYPTEAVQAGHQGQIGLAFTITAEGTVQDPHILNSSGYPELDQAALACVQNWRYKPAIRNNVPVAVPWRASVSFGLNAPFEHPALLRLSSDIRGCVKNSSALDRLPAGFYGITDLTLVFSPNRPPEVTLLGRSGDDELDSKAAECARASPALPDVAREMNTPGWVLSFNWGIMRQMGFQ